MSGSSAPLSTTRLNGQAHRTASSALDFVHRARLAHHVGDFTRWKDHDSYQRALERLLRDLKAGA